MAIRVAVMRGGRGGEHQVSLASGATVIKELPKADYLVRDLFVDHTGQWILDGLPISPAKINRQVEVVFNALHGDYGEDGEVQQMLDSLGVSYTGPRAFGARLAINKHLAKNILQQAGVKVPLGRLVRRADWSSADVAELVGEVVRSLPPPWLIKPADKGSSLGVRRADDVIMLRTMLAESLADYPMFLVEEFLRGREATCGVVADFRGQEVYALPPIEIRLPPAQTYFDYQTKYEQPAEEICPGRFNQQEAEVIMNTAILAHRLLDLRHYSRSDFIVTPRGVYFLETNSLPGLTTNSLLPKALQAVACPLVSFLDHVVGLAQKNF